MEKNLCESVYLELLFQNWDIGDVSTAVLVYFMSLVMFFGH